MGAQLKVVEKGFHRRQKHDAAILVKLLSPEMRDAVESLKKMLESTDEKIKLAALKLFFETHRNAVNDINQDELQRLIANVKFGGPKQLEVDDDDTPDVDFTQVLPAN